MIIGRGHSEELQLPNMSAVAFFFLNFILVIQLI